MKRLNFLKRASGLLSAIPGISEASPSEARSRNLEARFQISGARFGGGRFRNPRNRAQEPRSALQKIESRFRGRFQDAPARIELRGFEAGGGEASGNPVWKYTLGHKFPGRCVCKPLLSGTNIAGCFGAILQSWFMRDYLHQKLCSSRNRPLDASPQVMCQHIILLLLAVLVQSYTKSFSTRDVDLECKYTLFLPFPS
jgi:hypothetical protein